MADPQSFRLSAIELGSRTAVEVVSSELLATAALLPMIDGGALPGGDALLGIAGWKTARALLIHGLTLRDELAEMYLVNSPDLPQADGVEQWIAGRPPVWWRSLLARGAHDGLTYYAQHMGPMEATEAIMSGWRERIPPRAALMSNRQLWREAVTAQALTWPGSDALLGAFLEMSSLLASCVAAVWNFAQAYLEKEGMPAAWPPLPEGADAVSALHHLTGRVVPRDVADELQDARRFLFVPTPSLGSHLLTARFGETVVAWGEVAGESALTSATGDASDALDALGNAVNRRILAALAEGPPRTAQALARTLSLHSSTLSRHLPLLMDVHLVASHAEAGRVTYRLDPTGVRLVRDWLGRLAR